MRLTDIEFIKLLPSFMRDDMAVLGLAHGIDKIVPSIATSLKMLPSWDNIDNLPESEHNTIAWEFNILWYDKGANITTKRDVIKNGLMVWQHLGTKWAVENVINAYFGEGYIKEWFDYNGEAGHFSVYSTNPSVTNEKLQEFLFLLDKVKRYSSKLDNIYITLTGEMPLGAGFGVHEISQETYMIGAKL